MNVIIFEYDSSYLPSAPILEVEVDGLNGYGTRSLHVLVDSGADATMLPGGILEAVGASYKETLWMRGITGDRVEVDLFLVKIRIGTATIRGLNVISTSDTTGAIIGRDVLNQLVVTLDGPAETTIVEQR